MIVAQFESLFTNIKNNDMDKCKDALEQLNDFIKKSLSDDVERQNLMLVLEGNLLKLAKENIVFSDKEVVQKLTSLILHFLSYHLDNGVQSINLESCTTLSNFAFKISEDPKLLQDNIETALLYKYLGEINYLKYKNTSDGKNIQKFLDKCIDNFFLSSCVFRKIQINNETHVEVLMGLLRAYKEQLQGKLSKTQGQYSEFADEPLENILNTLEIVALVKFKLGSISDEDAEKINEYGKYAKLISEMRDNAYLGANSHSPNFKQIEIPASVFSPLTSVNVSTFGKHDDSPFFDKQKNIDNRNTFIVQATKDVDLEIQQILEKKPKVVFYPLKADKLLGTIAEELWEDESTPAQSRRASDASASPKSMSPKSF